MQMLRLVRLRRHAGGRVIGNLLLIVCVLITLVAAPAQGAGTRYQAGSADNPAAVSLRSPAAGLLETPGATAGTQQVRQAAPYRSLPPLSFRPAPLRDAGAAVHRLTGSMTTFGRFGTSPLQAGAAVHLFGARAPSPSTATARRRP